MSAAAFLTSYRQAAQEREALGVPALALNAGQTQALTELLEQPPAGEEAFLMRSDPQGHWSPFRAAIVMPHRRHEFDGCRRSIAQIFVEPETVRGRALVARFATADITRLAPEDIEAIADLRRAHARKETSVHALRSASERVVDSIAGSTTNRPSADARITAAVDFISRQMASGTNLRDVAQAVHLSPGRLRHLFVEQTGTTYRGYVLWLRINRAVATMMDGRTWTDAAHEAGFADSAHLSRMFRRMFGISPTMLVREW